MVSGSVREGLRLSLWRIARLFPKLPDPTDILAGKVKDCETREPVLCISWTVSLCYELKDACDKNDKKFDDKVNNFLRFAMDNFDTELVVLVSQTCSYTILPPIPDEVECFDEFHERFGKYIQAAQSA